MVDTDGAGAAVARRRLGAALRELRRAAGLSQEQAAAYLESSRPTVNKLENGRLGVLVKARDVNALCDLYGACDARRAELLHWAELSAVKGWFHKYSDVLPPGFNIYVGLEAEASSIFAYENALIHGLLQTPAYAEQIIGIGRALDDPWVTERVEVRMRRQHILHTTAKQPTRLHYVLSEATLRHIVGGPGVMAEQLHHLNRLGELPNITIQVVPFASGAHHGLVAKPFAILRFRYGGDPPIVYMDHFIGHLLFDRDDDLARFDAAATTIASHALDVIASRDLIHRTAKELSHVG